MQFKTKLMLTIATLTLGVLSQALAEDGCLTSPTLRCREGYSPLKNARGCYHCVNTDALRLTQVLLSNHAATEQLFKQGNQVTDVTIKQTSGEYTRYGVTVQQCQLRGCLGGAQLRIEETRDLTPGKFPPYRYRAEVVNIK